MNMNNNLEDDGSLDFLQIPRDENSRSFNCPETTQSKIVNTTFWVTDFLDEVPTRFSKAKGNRKDNVKLEDYRQALCSWFGWAKYSNSRHLTKKILKPDLMNRFPVAKSM